MMPHAAAHRSVPVCQTAGTIRLPGILPPWDLFQAQRELSGAVLLLPDSLAVCPMYVLVYLDLCNCADRQPVEARDIHATARRLYQMRRVVPRSSRYCIRTPARRIDRVRGRYRVDACASAAVHRWVCSIMYVKRTTADSSTSQHSALCPRSTPRLVIARGTCTGCIMVSFFGCYDLNLANGVVSAGRVLFAL